MDIHASDPVLIAGQQHETGAGGGEQQSGSVDIMELCRIFLLDMYLKHFGRARIFDMLQRDHERHQLPTGRALLLTLTCFLLTWLLQTNTFNRLAEMVLEASFGATMADGGGGRGGGGDG